jgi:PDZ domain-containing protein
MKQKTYGAIDAGAEYLLVPSSNFAEAEEAAGDDIIVIAVDTLDDAITFLDSLAAA